VTICDTVSEATISKQVASFARGELFEGSGNLCSLCAVLTFDTRTTTETTSLLFGPNISKPGHHAISILALVTKLLQILL